MESIRKLRERAEAVSRMVEENESALASDLNNFSHKLSLRSLKEHLADLHSQTGIEFLNQGNYPDAEREFKKAIELKPSSRGILLNSVLHNTEGDWARAIPLLRLLLRIDPTYEHARTNLAIAYLNYGVEKITAPGATEEDRIAAVELFYLALAVAKEPDVIDQIRENFAAFHTNLGIRYYEASDLGRTIVCMRRAFEALPNERGRRNLGTAYAHLALFYMSEGNYSEAIDPFERAEDAGLLHQELINDYGVALAKSGRRDEAKLAFERALEIAPDNRFIQANLSFLVGRESREVPVTEPVVEISNESETVSSEALFTQTFFPEFIPVPTVIHPYQVAA